MTSDTRIIRQVEDYIHELIGKIDAVFATITGVHTQSFAALVERIYVPFVFANLRHSRLLNYELKLSEEELSNFWQELQALIVLFNENGVLPDPNLLRSVAIYGGLEYWQKFFESEEFLYFKDSPGTIRSVATNTACDPWGVLRAAIKTVNEILEEDEFADYVDSPAKVRQAVLNHPSDPRAHLRNLRKKPKAKTPESPKYVYKLWKG